GARDLEAALGGNDRLFELRHERLGAADGIGGGIHVRRRYRAAGAGIDDDRILATIVIDEDEGAARRLRVGLHRTRHDALVLPGLERDVAEGVASDLRDEGHLR